MNTAVTVLTVGHVAVSLVGLLAGFLVLGAFLGGMASRSQTALFLVATITTNVSGFLFPVQHVTPAHVLGVISLAILSVAVYAYYRQNRSTAWRTAYVVSTVLAQYLNFFVLVVQLFLKVPALKAIAPTQTEPAFAISQLVTLAAFTFVGILSVVRSRQQSNTTQVTGLTQV